MKISKSQVHKMIRQVLVLFLAGLLAVQVTSTNIKSLKTKLSNINPRDLLDDAQQNLDELRDTVESAIIQAINYFGNLGASFGSYSDNILQAGEIDIDQEHETITGQITALRDLGYTADVDVSSCVDVREEVINRLPAEYKGHIRDCVLSTGAEISRIIHDADYYVDITINDVNVLEYQLGLCASENILCISPIVTQIELDMTQLPQSISVEIDRTSDLVDTQKITVQDCSDTRVTEYSSQANSILTDISSCVNRLIP